MIILAVLFVIYGVFASVPVCPTSPFSKPSSSPFTVSYPDAVYNLPILFPDNFQCEYQISVPENWFAEIEMFLNPNRSMAVPPVTVIDAFQINSSAPPIEIHVNQTDTVPFMHNTNKAGKFIITADTQVSMTVITSKTYMDLRGVLIYDGTKFLGSAYNLYLSKKQMVSSGNQMTVEVLSDGGSYYLPALLWQDYSNTRDIVQYLDTQCFLDHNCGAYSLDASKGPVALQSISPDYVYNRPAQDILMSVQGAGSLDVFMGGVTKDKKNSIVIYNAATSSPYLPQQFVAPLKTYLLTYGQATLNITRKSFEFGRTTGFPRKGFIQSNYYGQLKAKQDGNGVIRAPEGSSDAKFKVKIGFADMAGNTIFELQGTRNGENTFYQMFNSTNLPDLNNAYSISGDTLTVFYYSKDSYTTGMFLRFEVNPA
uniref:CUB_2 domain-containing protein n=1 Tax=Caenorhabditis tropicalis TaxID=1561998 RepID=A0A1I7TUI1_9PELO